MTLKPAVASSSIVMYMLQLLMWTINLRNLVSISFA